MGNSSSGKRQKAEHEAWMSTLGRADLHPSDFLYRFVGHHGLPRGLCSIAFDEAQGLLAVGCNDGAIKVFGAEGVGVLLRGPSEENDAALNVSCLGFSPCTTHLVSVSADSSVHVWDVEAQKMVAHLLSSWTASLFTTISFSAKFPFAYLGDADGCLHVLDLMKLQISGYETNEEKGCTSSLSRV